uniref:mRNA-decapping enzyme C-terminal domain-containing protein n=1 Tax=Plectus sambesii TaxID=2011161 RepID=A0A914XPE9_9BILA
MRLDSIPVTFELGGPSGSASPAVKPAEINARELFPPIQASRMSTASLQGSTTMLGVGVMETSTPRTSADNDPLLLDEMRSAAAELSLDDSLSYAIASEQLLRPADLMARQSVSVNSLTNGGMRLGASAFTMEHERPASVCARPNGLPNITPLTQEQMVQGFVHLLKTDAQFVGKLHQAYVESLNMGLSFGR